MAGDLAASVIGFTLVLAILVLIVWNEYRLWCSDRRAERLARHFLTPEEQTRLYERGYLDIPSQLVPGRFYRIPLEPAMVTMFEPGQLRRLLCLKPHASIPLPEHLLIHKLMLEGAEEEYLRRANCFIASTRPAPR